MTAVVALLLVVVAALGATSMLGRNASSKFSSVGYAICSPRGGDVPALPSWAGTLGLGVADHLASGASGLGGCGGPLPSAAGAAGGDAPPTAPASSGAARVAAPSAPSAPSAPAATAEATVAAPGALDTPTGPGPAAAGHAFVSTATLTVRVAGTSAEEVAASKREAVAKVAAAGGGLFGEQSAYDGEARSTVTLKVPSASFVAVLDDLAGLGELVSQDVKTDEVTQQVIDLDARIVASTNGLERQRALLAKATALGDVNQLEADVNRREAELEALRGQQQALAQRIDLSTIALTLVSSAPAPPAPVVAASPAPPALPGFLDGLSGGWRVFTNVGTVALAGLGAVLPFLPVVAAALIGWRVWRRRSRRAAAPLPSAAGG